MRAHKTASSMNHRGRQSVLRSYLLPQYGTDYPLLSIGLLNHNRITEQELKLSAQNLTLHKKNAQTKLCVNMFVILIQLGLQLHIAAAMNRHDSRIRYTISHIHNAVLNICSTQICGVQI